MLLNTHMRRFTRVHISLNCKILCILRLLQASTAQFLAPITLVINICKQISMNGKEVLSIAYPSMIGTQPKASQDKVAQDHFCGGGVREIVNHVEYFYIQHVAL